MMVLPAMWPKQRANAKRKGARRRARELAQRVAKNKATAAAERRKERERAQRAGRVELREANAELIAANVAIERARRVKGLRK